MKKIAVSALIIISIISVNIFAQQEDIKLSFSSKETEGIYLKKIDDIGISSKYNKLELADKLLNQNTNVDYSGASKFKKNVLLNEAGKKSMAKAIIFSALIPGTGELYAKSYLKAAIFFAVEVASWIYYASYQSKGNTQTDKFQTYANQYWNVRKYGQWLKDMNFTGQEAINPNEGDLEVLRQQIMSCESQNFSHTLPEYYSQQYYELIGKYQNFQAGWTNLSHEPDNTKTSPYYYEVYRDPVFVNYSYERQKANDYYNYSKTGIYVAILNHILSAADAAWCVSVFNQNLKIQTGFNIKRYQSPVTGEVGNLPSFNLRVDF
jgi:hypothetical protein